MAGRTQAGPQVWRLGKSRRPAGPHVAAIPGAEVPLLALDLPEKLRGMARERVAQRMLADRLAVPLEAFEIRPFLRKGLPWTRAVVAEAAALEAYRGQLSADCLALVPDYALLPCAPGLWALEERDGAVLARLGPEDGFAAEPELAAALFQEAAERGLPEAVLVQGEVPEVVGAVLDGLEAPRFTDVGAMVKAKHARPLRFTDAIQGLDLIDAPSAVFDRLRGRVAAWRWPVLVAVLALAAYLGNLWAETEGLEQAALADRQSTRDMVRQHFVPSGPILDIRAQVSAALASAATDPEVAERDIDPLLQFQAAAPFFDIGDIEVETVSFSPGSGLVITVAAVDFQALDFLVEDLRGGEFLVEVLESASRAGEGVSGRLRLSQAGG